MKSLILRNSLFLLSTLSVVAAEKNPTQFESRILNCEKQQLELEKELSILTEETEDSLDYRRKMFLLNSDIERQKLKKEIVRDEIYDFEDHKGNYSNTSFSSAVAYSILFSPDRLKTIRHLAEIMSKKSLLTKIINGHGMEALVIENAFSDHQDIPYKKNADMTGEYLKLSSKIERVIKEHLTVLKTKKLNLLLKEQELKNIKNDESNESTVSALEANAKLGKIKSQLEEIEREVQKNEEELKENQNSILTGMNHGSHVAGILSQKAPGVRIVPALTASFFNDELNELFKRNEALRVELQPKREWMENKLKEIEVLSNKILNSNDSIHYSNYNEFAREIEEFELDSFERQKEIRKPTLPVSYRNAVYLDGEVYYEPEKIKSLLLKKINTLKIKIEEDIKDVSSKMPKDSLKILHPMRGRIINSSTSLEIKYEHLFHLKDSLIFYAVGNKGSFLSEDGIKKCKEGHDIYTSSALRDKLVLVGNYDGKKGKINQSSNLPGNAFANHFLYAPGTDIESTVLSSDLKDSKASYTGTSMSAPHAAGLGVLLDKYFPDAQTGDIKNALLESATQFMAPELAEISGKGLIHGWRAAFALMNTLDKGNSASYRQGDIMDFLFTYFPEVNYDHALTISETNSKISNRPLQRIMIINAAYDYIMDKINTVEKSIGWIQGTEDLQSKIDACLPKDPASKYLSQRIYNWLKPL